MWCYWCIQNKFGVWSRFYDSSKSFALGCFLPDCLSIFFLLFFVRNRRLTTVLFSMGSCPMLIFAASKWKHVVVEGHWRVSFGNSVTQYLPPLPWTINTPCDGTCVIKLLSITYLARECWLVTDGGNWCVWLLTSVCVSRYSGSQCSVWLFSSCTVSSEFSLCGCAKIVCTVCSCLGFSIISEGATHFLGRTNSSLGILALENWF